MPTRVLSAARPYNGAMQKQWLLVLLAINALTFLVYGYDKWCARSGRRRVAERHLLALAFLCGWVGAWMAMSTFRHKTRKTGFRWRLLLVTLLNPSWLLLWYALRL